MPTTKAFTTAIITRYNKVGSASIAGTSIGTVDTISAASFRAARYLITATNGTDYHTIHIMVQHDGTNTQVVQFASIYDVGELATYEADINSGNLRLRATPANAGTTNFKFSVELVEA